ncbi:MAG: orotidine 5'-phosphate decarboxylase / HUMPS family protein, partial [Nitrospirota bacterium]|nr:orotidine 5'-phosphate decarboxylase / HUMPS family protein [Nitrospirota bacterium]
LAQKAALDGVVASPLETKLIRDCCGENFLVVTPGIRPAFTLKEDQKRIMTPRQAVAEGSNILVIGRPLYASNNPRQAAEEIQKEIS